MHRSNITNLRKASLIYLALVCIYIYSTGFTSFQDIPLKIANGYKINFISKDATGYFSSMKGNIKFNDYDLKNCEFQISIDVNSINTNNIIKNMHAKSDKWFDVEKYPFITFNSSEFVKVEMGYNVIGTLELHGIKKMITIPFTFRNNTFAGTFTVDRMDYAIGKPGKVSDEIRVEVSVPVTK